MEKQQKSACWQKLKIFKGGILIPRKTKECHLFYGIGDDEIQIDSFDKKLNESVLHLAEKEPAAVVIINGEDKPAYLRAAVKMKNLSIQFHKTVSDKAKKSRSENGKRHTGNLKNQKNKKRKDKTVCAIF